jgi:hypothetical protein
MTQFIGTSDIRALLRRTGIEPFLTGLAGYIEADFRRWESFEKAARLASHSRDGVIELMPASDGELYAMKFVNGHPGNTAAGKLTVTAFGVLADVATGYPVLVSEMTILTALRTAATSSRQPGAGVDRRRRPVGVSGPRLQGAAWGRRGAGVRHRQRGDGQVLPQPRGQWPPH